MLRVEVRPPITRVHMARTLFGRPLYTVSAYLVDGLLIDAGCPGTARKLVDWCTGQEIRRVVNTHHHEDHSGANGFLQAEMGLDIAAPAEAIPILANFPQLPLYRRLVWGQPGRVVVEPLDRVVETERYRFEVIPTPGHSSDHVCLFEPEQGWLFSGDLFIHERARYLRRAEDARRILESLRCVLTLHPRLLICGHAGFVEDGAAAIERKIACWEGLTNRARALQAEGHQPREIAWRLLGPEEVMTRVSGGDFSKENLIRSLLKGDCREG
jgi:glyoxylase-like metal-dependent hydrolase (beta-lactamase superfamily II)